MSAIDPHESFGRKTLNKDGAELESWKRVALSVVRIHVIQPYACDASHCSSSEATGFVVDKDLILTVRHVVGTGPFKARGIFSKGDDVELHCAYIDPEHDYAFLRFDPAAVVQTRICPLLLKPDLAQYGVNIRVLGNDAGGELSISPGYISRLDCNAPQYEGYSDCNTYYIQAAVGTSGGSSGSPVVNQRGFVVGIDAGKRIDTSIAFFLPVDGPLRALGLIRQGLPIARGTIQTQWKTSTFTECRPFGLSPSFEQEARDTVPNGTGMLVAKTVVPGGPSSRKIEVDDILLKVNGVFLTQFMVLESILNDSVGKTVCMTIQRYGSTMELEVNVEDLHDLVPSKIACLAETTFHDLTWTLARTHNISLEKAGVYLYKDYDFMPVEFDEEDPLGWLVYEVDNKETPNLDYFINVIKGIPDGKRITLKYSGLSDLNTHHTRQTTVHKYWNKYQIGRRCKETGQWVFESHTSPPSENPLLSPMRRARFETMSTFSSPILQDLARSFVQVTVTLQQAMDGSPRESIVSHGMVLDADRGLVIISRIAAPHDLGDITVLLAGSLRVQARSVFMHPTYNYNIIQYETGSIDVDVYSACFTEEPLQRGSRTTYIGFNESPRLFERKTTVTDIRTVILSASGQNPRYRTMAFDTIDLATDTSDCREGILVDGQGLVQALWLSFHIGEERYGYYGFAVPNILPILDDLKNGKTSRPRILDVELAIFTKEEASSVGVEDGWLQKMESEYPERHQFLHVLRTSAGHGCGLKDGDVLLTLNEKLVSSPADLDVTHQHTALEAVVVRDKKAQTIRVSTIRPDQLQTDHIVTFFGASLQVPHQAVQQRVSTLPSSVYISSRKRGYPAESCGLRIDHFITHVRGVPTPDLSAFLAECKKLGKEPFAIRTVSLRGISHTCIMQWVDFAWFPIREFVKDPQSNRGWRIIEHS